MPVTTTAVSYTHLDVYKRQENYSPVLRIAYTSYLTPRRVYDYFPMSQTLLLRRERCV